MTSTKDINLENVRIYMQRKDGEEFYKTYGTEPLSMITPIDFEYPYNDLRFVVVEYYEESYEGGGKWVAYYMKNYEFSGE